MFGPMYDYFSLKYGKDHVIEFTIKPDGKIIQNNNLTAWQQKTYDLSWKYQRSGTEFHAYKNIASEHGYVMYEALFYLPTLSHRWIRAAILKVLQDTGDVEGYAVDITRIKNNPVFQLDILNETLWWGPTKGKVGCKRRDLVILTHSMRGMPHKYVAETMSVSIKTVERVLTSIRTDLELMFFTKTEAIDNSKSLREMLVELDVLPFLLRKLDWFNTTTEYQLTAPLQCINETS